MELLEAHVPYDTRLHPRDRRGRWRDVAHYLRSLGMPGLHTVGGAVRDEALGRTPKDHDFIAIGHDHESIKEALEPHGHAEDLIVADRPVGVRFWPDDPDARALAPSGIEITPPRTEVSTGPGHQDFEIVADASVPFAEDAKRRDFTVNAMARALDTGELLDPLGGEQDAKDGLLRTTSPTSFRDDPLRIVRGLRFVAQLDLTPTPETREQMKQYAAGVEHLSGERIKDQLDKLLMGDHPAKALRLARDTGVLPFMLPELAPTIGFQQQSKYHGLTADEHIFQVVQAAADAGAPLEVRLAALFHDSGKPESSWMGDDEKLHYYENAALGKRAHEDIGAEKARGAMDRLGYSRPVENAVVGIVAHHMFQDHNSATGRRVRRFLSKHGPDRAGQLIAHKRADIAGKESDSDERIKDEVARLDAFQEAIGKEVEQGNAFTLKQLRINGDDLLKLGVAEGPKVGAVLNHLLGEVISDPTKNDPDWLRGEARRVLKEGVPTRSAEPSGTAANRATFEGMGSGGEEDVRSQVEQRERELLHWMAMMSGMRKSGFWPAYPGAYPGGMDQLIREHGRVFTKMGPSKKDYDPEYTEPKQCFYNAFKVSVFANPGDELTYVEGMAFPPSLIPVHHAWLVDSNGFVHDPTWDFESGTVYAGVPFEQKFLQHTVLAAGTTGVLDKIDYSKSLPDDAVKDFPLEPTVKEREEALGIEEPKMPGGKITLGEAYVERVHPRDRLGRWRRKFGIGKGRKLLHDPGEVLRRVESEGTVELPHGARIQPAQFEPEGYDVFRKGGTFPGYAESPAQAVELATSYERGDVRIPPMAAPIEALIADALDDPSVKPLDKDSGGDLIGRLAIESQGKDGPPRVVADEEFDRMLAAGEIREFWRGVPSRERAEQFATGDLFVWPGNYGSGIYVSDMRKAAERFTGRGVTFEGAGVVMRIGVPVDARVATTSEIDKLREEDAGFAYRQYQQVLKHPDATERDKEIAKAIYVAQIDPGVIAATRGFDMIDATEGADWDKPQSPYYNLLNRSGVVLSEGFRGTG